MRNGNGPSVEDSLFKGVVGLNVVWELRLGGVRRVVVDCNNDDNFIIIYTVFIVQGITSSLKKPIKSLD